MANRSFDTLSSFAVGDSRFSYHSLPRLRVDGATVERLPYSIKILLENLLRCEDGVSVRPEDIEAVARWRGDTKPDKEIAFMPARVILQDFTGVPAVVDLAAMRDALADLGGDPKRINPQLPSELVIDHSVQVDVFGTPDAFRRNTQIEVERNHERYQFLRWGQKAFDNFKVVPPGTGIVHQVNLEYLARVVFTSSSNGETMAYPDSLVGTDSHTTMVNGLGVLGWGVGGIEAEAAMLGQPISMLIPQVVGFRFTGKPREGTTATDIVLTVTEMMREFGVVAKFVEFFGEGLANLTVSDRATMSNMSPEFGSTCAIFPIDDKTLEYLRLTGRDKSHIALVEAYAKEQGLFHSAERQEATYSAVLELDLSDVEPSLAGPKRPQDRVPLAKAKPMFLEALPKLAPGARNGGRASAPVQRNGDSFDLEDGAVVIAAITSCTNTSNPAVLVGAGLVARKAVERGLRSKPWVKTSLAPGSQVVTDYLKQAELMPALESLGFHLVGYGCTTCIGNSGPLPEEISKAIGAGKLVTVSVLSGNRNFEGRINPEVRGNYLASPMLVVAYALAGRMDIDLYKEPLGQDKNGKDVFLKDIWPTSDEIHEVVRSCVKSEYFSKRYADVFTGDDEWRSMEIPEGNRFAWTDESTYVQRPTFFDGMKKEPPALQDIEDARVLAMLGDSVTTDHISPAGSIPADMPAGKYLTEHGVERKDFNSFGSRRGNHEVMVRGTFGNVRLRNELAPETEGGWTRLLPTGKQTTIYDAAVEYAKRQVPLVVLAGKEYGSGSSRDWAAKGTVMLGVRAVIAESFERIHRSNLIGMGVLPLQFADGETRKSLDLTGEETFSIQGIADGLKPGKTLKVIATPASTDDPPRQFDVTCRIDTPVELEYYRHGGILQYVLRQLM